MSAKSGSEKKLDNNESKIISAKNGRLIKSEKGFNFKLLDGKITTIDNRNLLYNGENYEQRGIIIASNNKDIHGEICSEIQGIIKKYNLDPFN